MRFLVANLSLKRYKPLSPLKATLFYSVAFCVLYHIPLFHYAYTHSEPNTFSSYQILLTTAIAIICANGMLFLGISLISRKVLRFFVILFALLNSIALYFISTYGVFLNKSMMSNALNTNTHEVLDLLSFKMLVFIVFLGIIPSYIFYKLQLKKSKRKRQILALVVLTLVFAINAFINAKTWLWFDRHAKFVGGLSLPFSYSINAFRAEALKFFAPKVKALPPFFPTSKNTLVVLVIGESARKHNYALYGYERPTTPKLNIRLSNQEIHALEATSCTTYTTASLECILNSSFEKSHFSTYENLPTYLTKAGIKVFWYSANDGEKNVKVTHYLKRSELIKKCRTCKEIAPYDEALLYNVPNLLKEHSNENVLLILHLAGSHGPRYDKKVPLNFRVFKPYCSSVDLANCSKESLINAYDNTIFYNDYVLDKLIGMLKNAKQPALMLYLSDHGESLGEGAYYLHGAPKAIAPKEQYEIPFILYANKIFKERRELLVPNAPLTQSTIFHSILGAFGADKSPNSVYKPHLDLFKNRETHEKPF
ncbi:phosphoethanolamine--lipid A transferase EptA [Helicobacter cetorum]|uniref:phosphoethanolamine--lipid A transferase EptA n=1 Tax=Helicobacter cetorum TaxID=138563 RepID=UPI000CF13947|nr:phosphoethanolamine--lipid A transferase EptA [Helicobacter cetorum]